MFETLPSQTPKSSFAKIATILAVTAGIAFGLCTVGAVAASNLRGSVVGIAAAVCGSIVLLCLAALIVLAVVRVVIEIIRIFRSRSNN